MGDELRDYRILFRWDIPAVESLLGFTVVIVRRLRFGNRDEAHDRDAKPATLIHPTSCRNQQVSALNFDESRREPAALPARIPLWRVAIPLLSAW